MQTYIGQLEAGRLCFQRMERCLFHKLVGLIHQSEVREKGQYAKTNGARIRQIAARLREHSSGNFPVWIAQDADGCKRQLHPAIANRLPGIRIALRQKTLDELPIAVKRSQ